MSQTPDVTRPLLRLGRLELGTELRGLPPAETGAELVATATVEVPESDREQSAAWDVAWNDAAREATGLGADQRTAEALRAGAGNSHAPGIRAVVAARGQTLLARSLPAGSASASVHVGPLPHLREVAAAAARRPAYVVVLADRDGTDVITHAGGDQAGQPVDVGTRPGEQPDPHPDRPPGLHHGERHLTDREPESGGERNASYVAGRVEEAAASVGAHIVLGAGDQHILDAISEHLATSAGPVTAFPGARAPGGGDAHLSAAIGSALDEITAAAIDAVRDLVASGAAQPEPAAVIGVTEVAQQLAEQQVAVLLVGADLAKVAGSYRIGAHPTDLVPDDLGVGVPVPLEDGMVWSALHQDAIVVALPDDGGPLAGTPAAALLRRGQAG